ncbi:putative mitochondrial saccharopine dehydrogenase-like oxidoreductase [Arachis hypogaea]|nr:putative mitochondrial saccharopine dehydrogenase-like oxidoreductase [Arachis hypogaea]
MASSSSTPQLFDLVILGASGFTGKHVLKQALKFLKAPSSPLRSIALAGRSPSNLSRALQWASGPNSPPTDIPLLTADTSDPDSLRALCSRTRLLLNCVGPFRRHGDPVVAACAASGCDYLDITGEAEFMERMEARYHESAMESGSLVWVGESSPYRVVGYLTADSERGIVGNFGTFESAVLAVESVKDLEDLRRSRPARTRPAIPGPPPKGALIEHQKKIGLWGVVLPSADSTLVGRTFSTLTENPYGLPGRNESADMVEKRKAFWSSVKPTHFEVKLGSKHLLSIFVYITIGIFIGLLGKTSFGRWLLLKYPSVFTFGGFSKNGPSKEEVESASFKMWFVGHGYSKKNVATERNRKPDMEIITRVMGPEMGYVTTPIILIQCALVLLSQRDNLPKGGVYTPGIVFGATDLRDRLQQNGLSFDVITKSKLSS